MLHIFNIRTQLEKLTMITICVIGAVAVLIWGKTVLCPLVVALLLSISLLSVAAFFEKRLRVGRALSSFTTSLVFFSLLAVIFYFISRQVATIDWKGFGDQVSKSVDSLDQWCRQHYNLDIHQQLGQMKTTMTSSGSKMAEVTLMSFSGLLIFIIFIIFYTFFLLFYRHRLLAFLLSLVKKENTAPLTDIVNRVLVTIRSYLVGVSLEVFIVSTCCCIVYKLIGVPYFMFMGILTGVLNVIPYAGILTALTINVVITFGVGGITKILWLVGATGCVHLIDSNLILPFIVGGKVRLNAFVVLVGVALGEMIWSIPGMFLATPVLGVFKIIGDHIQGFKSLGILLGDGKDVTAKEKETE